MVFEKNCYSNVPVSVAVDGKSAFLEKQTYEVGSKPIKKVSLKKKTQEVKPVSEDNGSWGPIYKNRQNFTDMHFW